MRGYRSAIFMNILLFL